MVFLKIPNVPKGTVFAEQVTYTGQFSKSTFGYPLEVFIVYVASYCLVDTVICVPSSASLFAFVPCRYTCEGVHTLIVYIIIHIIDKWIIQKSCNH